MAAAGKMQVMNLNTYDTDSEDITTLNRVNVPIQKTTPQLMAATAEKQQQQGKMSTIFNKPKQRTDNSTKTTFKHESTKILTIVEESRNSETKEDRSYAKQKEKHPHNRRVYKI